MLDAALAVQRWIKGKDRDGFMQDDLLQSAIIYQVQIVGEAASRISGPFRAAHPEIPWQDIIGMRQIVVHDYRRVSIAVLWDVATERIPELVQELLKYVSPLEEDT